MNRALDFNLYVSLVLCHCHDAKLQYRGHEGRILCSQFPAQAGVTILLSSGAAWFMVIQHKLLKYFADHQKGGKNIWIAASYLQEQE